MKPKEPFPALTEVELERIYPHIPWRKPLKVIAWNGTSGYVCRFCVARYGLKGWELTEKVLLLEPEVLEHLRDHHKLEGSADGLGRPN